MGTKKFDAVWNVRVGAVQFKPGQEITEDLTDEQVKQFLKDGAIEKHGAADERKAAAEREAAERAGVDVDAEKAKADEDAARALKAGTGSTDADAPGDSTVGAAVIDDTKATRTTRK